ncbi:MAG: DUF3598 family protein [Cyanosarcina radialis HA8281-LM2]|jgi:hypothetical protein|nr:DUF3598 family protein [Cyanosarcina radialis HA8281-LM2]
MKSTITTDDRLKNWDNFASYHALGDWYGYLIRHSSEGEVIDFLKCIRSFNLSQDRSEIYHQNRYIYADGKSRSKSFGSYKKPLVEALYLDNSFSWGSTHITPGSSFGFETGFRLENRGSSAVLMYDESGKNSRLTIHIEQLGSFPNEASLAIKESSNKWKGYLKYLTPDLVMSDAEACEYKPLDELSDRYQIFAACGGISICYPRQIESGIEMFFAVDWLVAPTRRQRAIRHYDRSGFTLLTLQTFTTD